jgi:hypothetical protein
MNLNLFPYVSVGSKKTNTRDPTVQISSLNRGKLPISGVIRWPFMVTTSSSDSAENWKSPDAVGTYRMHAVTSPQHLELPPM